MAYSYLKWFFFSVIVGTPLIAAMIFFLDPFEIHFSLPNTGVSPEKSGNYNRYSVAINMIKMKPKLVVLGTSRVAHGFDRQTLQKYSNGEPFLNGGFSGASFDEIYAYFLHALHVQPDLKTVILGIDLYSFTKNRKFQSDFNEELLQTKHVRFGDWKRSIFSRNAFISSVNTFYQTWVETKVADPILRMGEKKYLHYLLTLEHFYKNYELDLVKIEKFQHLVETCQQNSIDLKVFMSPLKAMYWEFYFQNGLWQHLEELKRRLCAIHPLWDFSGFNVLTTERLECCEAPLFHECSHYTSYMGDLLMQRMFNQPSIADSIGFLLTPETIDDALDRIKQDYKEWLIDQKAMKIQD